MGMYIYKVTGKTVNLTDGRKANVAVFAYKPCYKDDVRNNKMHFASGCVIADHWASKGKRTGLIVIEGDARVWEFTGGSFTDYLFDKPALENIFVKE